MKRMDQNWDLYRFFLQKWIEEINPKGFQRSIVTLQSTVTQAFKFQDNSANNKERNNFGNKMDYKS